VGASGQLQLSQRAAGDAPAATAQTVRSAERVDVAVGANGQISLRQQAAQGDAAPSGIMLTEVAQKDGRVQVEIADFGGGRGVQYRATLPDGSPLPPWIQVNPQTGQINAEPRGDAPLIQLLFTAQDANGNTRTLEIKIDLSQTSPRSGLPPATETVAGRPSFMDQLAAHQQHWDGYGQQLLSTFTAP
jgi:hypothetical protein